MKKCSLNPALIIGNKGQDGVLLSQAVENDHFWWVGINRTGICEGNGKYRGAKVTLLDPQSLEDFIALLRPETIYYLAAHHSSSEADSEHAESEWKLANQVHCDALETCLRAIVKNKIDCHLFYASSSMIFEGSKSIRQNELTQPQPLGVYAKSKVIGMEICRQYRKEHGTRASTGILYNHESHLRSSRFLSRKVLGAALAARAGTLGNLSIGSLSAAADWGYAPDFVDAFRRIAKLEFGDDFIIATDKLHTVTDWLIYAFEFVGLNWKDYITEDSSILKRQQVARQGDYSYIQRVTGWKPTTSFEKMIPAIMARLE